MIRMKKTTKTAEQKKAINPEEFIGEAKADGVKKKIFNFNLCAESIKALEGLSFHFEIDSLSQVIEKILKLFCTLQEEQEDFRKWKENFSLPETPRINRTYYLDPELHNCLVSIKRKFQIRHKGEMLRLLLFFYYKKLVESKK